MAYVRVKVAFFKKIFSIHTPSIILADDDKKKKNSTSKRKKFFFFMFTGNIIDRVAGSVMSEAKKTKEM